MDNNDIFLDVAKFVREMLDQGKGRLHIYSKNEVQFILDEHFLNENVTENITIEDVKNEIETIKALIVSSLSDDKDNFINIMTREYKDDNKEEFSKYIEDQFEKVEEYFITDELRGEYDFKLTSSDALNSIDWSLHKKIYDGSEQKEINEKYATINLKINNIEDQSANILTKIFKSESLKMTKFVCNVSDLNYLIDTLTNIKDELLRR
ncbi:hypothetical protein [Clostridium sp. DJ247]|uniref:hypothetical protein n=1 Tax=Clostridium sp. DJ247 TaxID=2726188 RepID=UPI001625688C|nr:hypothetical protein [Clostridium sp. DJ247]MBC2579585.1 hypothetical protein [Clostridium sp. DJ247]